MVSLHHELGCMEERAWQKLSLAGAGMSLGQEQEPSRGSRGTAFQLPGTPAHGPGLALCRGQAAWDKAGNKDCRPGNPTATILCAQPGPMDSGVLLGLLRVFLESLEILMNSWGCGLLPVCTFPVLSYLSGSLLI